MKQHITIEQLNELTGKEKDRLKTWFGDRKAAGYYSEWTGKYKLSVNHSPPIKIYTKKEAIKNGLKSYVLMLEKSDLAIGPGPEPLGWQLIERDKIYYPLLSIGQMIEFLDEHYRKDDLFVWAIERSKDKWELYAQDHESNELCDVLWEAVKEILHESKKS